MKKLFYLLPIIIFGFIIMTGQNTSDDNPRWNIDPRSTMSVSTGEYVDLPEGNLTEITQFTFSPRTIITPIGVFTASPNQRVHPNSLTQQCETDIVRHPTNPNIMFAAAQSIINTNNFINVGVYVSTDGGLSWSGKDTMNAPNLNDQRGDPAPVIDKNGNFIYGHLLSATNFGGLTGMGANYSTNNGATWSSTFTIMSDGNVDKNMIGTDGSPSSPYYGNTYMAWTVFAGLAGNGRVSRTTNGGVTWDPVIVLNSTPANHFAQGHDVAVASNGDVYVCWSANSSTSPYPEDFIGIAKSTNGGLNYTATENAYDVNGSRSASFNGWGIRTNGFPRIDIDKSGGLRNGWIYIVDGQINLAPAGDDADIIMRRSSDGGATWSSGIRVNQDAPNNGKVQFFPVVNVDDAGGVNVLYYDNRDFPSVGDSCSVYLSRSLDGGNTWTDMEVADHHFKPKNLPGINTMGDYIGLTSGGGKLTPVWMDDKAGPGTQFNIWTTSIQISTFPLNAFNLNTPAPGARIETLPNSTTNNTFTWDTSASTASYKWVFGSPTTTPRKITLIPTGNSLTVTSGELDNLLAGLGVAQGDSLVGKWDVWAFRNNAANDSLKASNGPRNLTLKRAKPLLTAFSLSSPPNNTSIKTLLTNTNLETFKWTKSGTDVEYKWLFASPNFAQINIKFSVESDNNGFDSVLTLRNSQLDSMLAGIGLAVGDSIVGKWKVYGYSGPDSLAAIQTFDITLRRGIPPTITATSDTIVVNVSAGQSTSRNLSLGNAGEFLLNWNLSESLTAPGVQKAAKIYTDEELNKMANQPKGSADLLRGEEQLDGAGGPDAGGYSWVDSDEPGGPAYNWVEISGTGTAISGWTLGADDGYKILPLTNSVPYYGVNYSQLKVCTNGWVSFDVVSTSAAYSNAAIPNTSEPNNCLYPFWDDLLLTSSGTVYYYNDIANNRFIVEYKNVPHYSSGGLYTFEVIINYDGSILYQYQSMANSLISATVGNENSTGTIGLQVVYNNTYVHNNLAVKISKGIEWLTENPLSGAIVPAGNQNVELGFNSTGLSLGSYKGKVKIASNDPVTPVKEVNVKMNVVSAIPASIILAVQGFYNNTTLNIRDTSRIYLRNINPPYSIVDSASAVIDSVTFTGSFLFPNAPSGTYYLQVKSRNGLETWSKPGGQIYTAGSPFSYNFTTTAAQTYGGNSILKAGKYCQYNGDINKDGNIDLTDVIGIFNASANFTSGYVVFDLNGDNITDLTDITIAYNNSAAFVSKSVPPGAGPVNISTERSGSENLKEYMKKIEEVTKVLENR